MGEIFLTITSVVGIATIGLILVTVIGMSCEAYFSRDSLIITCRCGQEFGHKKENVYMYEYDGMPVYKTYNRSFRGNTTVKAWFHRKFKCEGVADGNANG